MFNVSLPVADAIFTWANVVLVIGAVLAFVGTAAVFWSTGIRERYADERIAANEAETAKAKAETARALLEQERLKAQMAWRRISPSQAKRIAEELRGEPIEIWITFVGSDPEATVFREDINSALVAAGVKTKFFSGYERAVGVKVMGGTPAQRARLVNAFAAAGVQVIDSPEPGFMKTGLEILVGTKPPPEFQRCRLTPRSS
jgi:hypothetical protein